MDELSVFYNNYISKFQKLYDRTKFINVRFTMQKFINDHNIKKKQIENDIVSTVNLSYYQMYVHIMNYEPGIMMNIESEPGKRNMIIYENVNYIVSHNGYRWIKIIGSNKIRINNSYDEDFYGDYSIKKIINRFKEEIDESQYLPFDHKPEKIIVFIERPSDDICKEIENNDIKVKTLDQFPLQVPDLPYQIDFKTTVANLDVSTLITLCSELANITQYDIELPDRVIRKIGECNFNGIKDIVDNKNELYDEITKYEKIIVCKTAWDTFLDLVRLNGGKKENERVKDIEKIVEIVPDKYSSRFDIIKKSKGNLLNAVFGSGEKYYACTFTGNTAIINNFESKKLKVIHKLHRSFQLAEKVLYK